MEHQARAGKHFSAWRRRKLLGIDVAFSSAMSSKTWFIIVTAMNFLFIALMAKLLDSLRNRVPVGYQDESGFHFGVRKG